MLTGALLTLSLAVMAIFWSAWSIWSFDAFSDGSADAAIVLGAITRKGELAPDRLRFLWRETYFLIQYRLVTRFARPPTPARANPQH